MENSWQGKCSSTLQSSSTSLASSSSQELRNQTGRNAGCYFYPTTDPYDSRFKVRGVMQDSMFPNNLNVTSQRLGHVSLGNSFLALLSGPPSLLQCDFKDESNSKLMSDSNSVFVNAVGSGNPLRFSGIPSEQDLQPGVEVCPTILSRAVGGYNCSSNSVLSNLQNSDLDTTVVRCLVPGTEKAKGSFSSGRDSHITLPANAVKACGTIVQTSQMRTMESSSPTCNQSTGFLHGCPRVFCLGTGGHLLISNTGLLGIVCSCHCFHMSVLKFCEHSGLFGISPGDAVRMDSGETIAQWRKLYFQKFAIRVPEDQSDWDWPEELSATAGSVKSRATMPDDISHPVHSSEEGLVRSGQLLDNGVPLNNLHSDQNLVIGSVQNKQKKGVQDNNIHLKSLIGTSQSNMHVVSDTQTMQRAFSACSSVAKSVGSGSKDSCQSISDYVDSILKNRNSSISCPSMHDFRTITQNFDFTTFKNAQNGVFAGKNAAISSIDLKLGQPYQSSQNSKGSELPSLGSQLLETVVNPPKIHTADSQGKVEHGQFHCFPSTRREQNKWNLGNNAFQISDVKDAARLENSRGNLAQNAVVSLPNFNMLPGNNVQMKANYNMLNGIEHVMSSVQYHEPHFAKSGLSNVGWKGGNDLERQLSIYDLHSRGQIYKGKGVNFVTDGCYLMKDTGKRPNREMDIPNSYPFLSEAHGNSCSSNQLSNVPLEAPNSRKLYNYSEKIPSFGGVRGDCVSQRSLALSNESGITPPADPQRVPFATSTCMLDQTPGFGVNPHLHDDNLEMLALKQILELSKQQHAFPSLGLNKSEGRYEGVPSFFHSPADCSTRGEQRNGPGPSDNRDISEAAVRAGLSDTTNVNGCCDLSTLTQGISPNSNQIAMQCQLSSNRYQNEHPSTRYGKCGKNMAGSDECQNCCRATSTCFQRNYNCPDHVNSFDMTLDSRGENFPKVLMEHVGVTNGDGFRIFGSKFPQNRVVPNDKIMSLEQRRKLIGESPNHNVSYVSQWRDVPSKAKGVSSEMHGNNSASFLDQRVYDRGQTTKTHMNGTMQIMDSSKEHEISNISSGCSAPAITQLSVELSNMDGFSADDGDTGCVSNLVVDEGSEIDKSWSSDDAQGSEEGAEYLSATCKTSLKESGSSKNLTHHSPRSLLDELKLINSLAWKRCRTHIQTGITLKNIDNLSKKINRSSKKGKRKRDCSSLVHNERIKCIPCAEGTQMLSSSSQRNATCSNQHNSENRLPVLSSKKSSRKRDLSKIYGDSEETHVFPTELIAGANKYEIPKVSAGKKFRRDRTSYVSRHSMMEEPTHDDTRATKKYNSVGAAESYFHQQLNICPRKSRPIVCGKYGELSNGGLVGGMSRPAKIVSLSQVLKSAKRGTLPRNIQPTSTSTSEFAKTNNDGTDACCDRFNHLKTEKESRSKNVAVCGKVKSCNSSEKLKNSCLSRHIKLAEELPKSEMRHDKIRKDRGEYIKMKPKAKEIRKRSIYELTLNGKDSHPNHSKISKCLPEMSEGEPLKNVEDRKNGSCKNVTENFPQEQTSLSLQDSESFCCVCGGSNKDEINYLLECSRCFIKVHQACYGVSKVPKGNWCCRPCRTSSRNIVCVLCGYGGGAMTRALKSRAIVKSLLRVWNIETDCSPDNKLSSAKTPQNSPTRLNYSGSGCEEDASFSMIHPENSEPLASAVCKKDVPYHLEVVQNSLSLNKSKVQNSITAGLVDSTTKQWIHMVCGLWTSETRCPNVDTMSSFDVSGVSRPRADLVCSICSRPGGSCMKCRVINCSVQFHPWCAHQKGLLQSEVEGIDNENVGFYGRCVLHAKNPMCESDHEPEDWETDTEADKITCARTEGYKGRKRDGFWHNYYSQSKGKIGSLVPQEQLNAWIHINGQKSRIHGLPKIPASDIEHDCRKEYARYKQARSWKHLVVYKSGIHALGLYTSRFISRGEMVVEYVGEIVGLRVSDKRENEYQSGRKLQYKSACYFFRIDKEHVIDATRKGGIARFVNHSCLPNCVAKVISVKNEKKVVFFAERDIFPGEEITYDYHFNHEDEGKKIPCFCNSKNCRRYLN